jgi:hypothetical protein
MVYLPADIEELWVENRSIEGISKEILGVVWVDVGTFVLVHKSVKFERRSYCKPDVPSCQGCARLPALQCMYHLESA